MNRNDSHLYELKAEVMQAAAHPIRLAVIDCLRDGELCVCDVARAVGAERSNVSRHLSVLLKAGIVEVRRDGLKMMYSLRTTCVLRFLDCVTAVLKAQATDSAALLKRL